MMCACVVARLCPGMGDPFDMAAGPMLDLCDVSSHIEAGSRPMTPREWVEHQARRPRG